MDAARKGISGASFGPARRRGALRAAEVVEAFRVMALGFYPGWLLCDIQTRPAAAESAGEQGFTACSTVRTASPCSTALRRRSIATTTSTTSTLQPRKTGFPTSPSFASSRAARQPRILAPRKARRPSPAAGGSGAAARPGRGQSRGQDDYRGVAAADQQGLNAVSGGVCASSSAIRGGGASRRSRYRRHGALSSTAPVRGRACCGRRRGESRAFFRRPRNLSPRPCAR